MKPLEGSKEGHLGASNVVHQKGGEFIGRGAFIDSHMSSWTGFMLRMAKCLENVNARNDLNETISVGDALMRLREHARRAHDAGAKVIFIGNGGSAAIASHMAVDWTKNGGIRSIAFNDAPTLTCLANDFGYEKVFEQQIGYYAAPGDVVVIISSSGKSPNIVNAAGAAFLKRLTTITLTGMRPYNLLRRKGHINFYVPVMDYGLVELTHACLLHSIVSVRWPE